MNGFDQSFEYLLRKEIEEEIKTRSEAIASGNCGTLEDYRAAVATIFAFRVVLRHCDDLKKKLNED